MAGPGNIGKIVGAGLGIIAAGVMTQAALGVLKETGRLAGAKKTKKSGNKYIDKIIQEGKTMEDIVEKVCKKTLHDKKVAKNANDVVTNIL